MYYNKNKDTKKRYLTDMEVAAYMQELKNRCFSLGDISEKVFLDKSITPHYRREKLERVFDQEVMITKRERERLDFYCTCVIVTEDEFKEYQTLKYLKPTIKKICEKYNFDPEKAVDVVDEIQMLIFD